MSSGCHRPVLYYCCYFLFWSCSQTKPNPTMERGGGPGVLPLAEDDWQLVAAGRGKVSSLAECGPWGADHTPVGVRTFKSIWAAPTGCKNNLEQVTKLCG